MRILELFQPPDGGVPEHVRRLTDGLLARGHEVTVGGPADAPVRAMIEAGGARYLPLPIVGNMAAPREDAATYRAIARLLREHPYAVVHTHAQKAGLLGRLAARRAGVPSLYTPNSLVYRTQLLRPRRGARARYVVNRGVERALGRRTAAIVAVSEEERAAAVGDGLAPAGRVRLIHNGVAPERGATPDPELAAFRGEGPLLGFVAGLRDQKGLPTLLDALELLAGRGTPARTAIVGNGPLEAEVRARVADGPLAATTLVAPFAGRVEPYLETIDVFVLPSHWEGLPIAVLEAMTLGVPVIATAVGGTPEAVEDGVTGMIVPPADPAALADAIAELLPDAERRARMGAAAAERARERFGVERMVDGLEALYAEVAR